MNQRPTNLPLSIDPAKAAALLEKLREAKRAIDPENSPEAQAVREALARLAVIEREDRRPPDAVVPAETEPEVAPAAELPTRIEPAPPLHRAQRPQLQPQLDEPTAVQPDGPSWRHRLTHLADGRGGRSPPRTFPLMNRRATGSGRSRWLRARSSSR